MITLNDIKNSACAKRNHHLFAEPEKQKPKYGNIKTEVDGIKFDSKKEAKRYGELNILLKSGEIGSLERQVVFELKIGDKRVCKYVADFVYTKKTGERIVEDVKSEATRKLRLYLLKKKLMKELLGIEIKEV